MVSGVQTQLLVPWLGLSAAGNPFKVWALEQWCPVQLAWGLEVASGGKQGSSQVVA